MNLSNWNPLREMEDFFSRYNRRFGLSLTGDNGREALTTADWSPAVDIIEQENEFLLKVELPEIKKEDVKVTIDDGVLNISGERKAEKEEKDKKYHRIERFYGRFARSFSLPDNIKQSEVKAEFKNGILKIHLDKIAKAKPKEIDVKIAA